MRAQALSPEFVPGEDSDRVAARSGPDSRGAAPGRGLGAGSDDPARLASCARSAGLTGLACVGRRAGIRTRAAGRESRRWKQRRSRGSRKLPWVRYAEPNYYAHAAGDILVPNDPDYPEQWNMAACGCTRAWAATRGSLSFVVAVLDTGVAQSHPEFAGKLLSGRDYVNSPDYDGRRTTIQQRHAAGQGRMSRESSLQGSTTDWALPGWRRT